MDDRDRDPIYLELQGGKSMNLGNFLCKIGIHDWLYTSTHHYADRYCRRCGAHRLASYDMATGETVYL